MGLVAKKIVKLNITKYEIAKVFPFLTPHALSRRRPWRVCAKRSGLDTQLHG